MKLAGAKRKLGNKLIRAKYEITTVRSQQIKSVKPRKLQSAARRNSGASLLIQQWARIRFRIRVFA